MSQTETITRIREFLANASDTEVFEATSIASALDEPLLTIKSALAQMVGKELVHSHQMADGRTTVYKRSGAFVWRHITPLFAGTPEHIVETYDGRLICWCPSEFDARIISDALKRS